MVTAARPYLHAAPAAVLTPTRTRHAMAARPVPEGYRTVTPYLVVRDALRVLDFVTRAFGAVELRRTPAPTGGVLNVEVRIGDSTVMLVEARAAHDARPAALYLYVPDTDAVYARAIDAGARSLLAPADMFYGDRSAGIEDPGGTQWWIATRLEDLTSEELGARAAAQPTR